MDGKTTKKIYTKPKVMGMDSIVESVGRSCRGGSVPGSVCRAGSVARRGGCMAGSAPGTAKCQNGSAASGSRCRSGNFPGS